MFSFFKSKEKANTSIILDVQSGLVRGALVNFKEGSMPYIVSVVTKSIPSSLIPTNSQRIVHKTLKIAHEVVAELVRELKARDKHNKIDFIHYVLSSPWVFSEIKTIKINYEKKTEITRRKINEIVKEEVEKSATLLDKQPIEQNIFEIKLNGYPISLYECRVAQSLEISLSTSFGSKVFLNKLNEIVEKSIHIRHHTYHAALIMQYSAFRSMSDSKQEYIYIHVHSELTDIIIVKNGLCKHISSFPFGITTLLRKVSHSMGQGMELSDSFLTLYQSNKLDEKEKANAKKVLDPLINAWSALCQKSFSNIFNPIHIPRTVFISSHSHFDLFKEALLFNNNLNFDIIAYETNSMKMYTLVLNNMI